LYVLNNAHLWIHYIFKSLPDFSSRERYIPWLHHCWTAHEKVKYFPTHNRFSLYLSTFIGNRFRAFLLDLQGWASSASYVKKRNRVCLGGNFDVDIFLFTWQRLLVIKNVSLFSVKLNKNRVEKRIPFELQ